MLVPALLLCLLQTGPLHALATVNDPRSHGVVGDNLLSLNETILLCNFQLSPSQLSAAERAQIVGVGEPSTVHIDTTRVPVLRVERDLDVVQDHIDGYYLEGINGTPTIDFGATRGFRTAGSFQSFRRLRLYQGDVAIDSLQDSGYHTSVVEEITCEGQRVAGMRFVTRGSAPVWRLILDDCRFVEVPQAVLLREEAVGSTSQLDLERITTLRGGGVDLTLGTGGSMILSLMRIACESSSVAIRRPTLGHDQSLRVTGTHVLADRLTVDGHPAAAADLRLGSVDLLGPGPALLVGRSDAPMTVQLEDLRTRGDVDLLGGPAATLSVANARCETGVVRLAGTVRLERCRLDAAAVSAAAGAVTLGECDVLGGSLEATGGALTVQRGHLDGVRLGAGVTVLDPRATAWHGAFEVSPAVARVGGLLEFRHAVPPGGLGLWSFGPTRDLPQVHEDGGRLYALPGSLTVLPAVLHGTGRFVVRLPSDPRLRLSDLFVQGLVLPAAGEPGPALLLPAGQRVTFQ